MAAATLQGPASQEGRERPRGDGYRALHYRRISKRFGIYFNQIINNNILNISLILFWYLFAVYRSV